MATAATELFKDIASKYAPNIQITSFKLILALTTDPHDTEEFRDKDIVQVEDIGPQPYPEEEYTRPRPEDFIPA